jgi:hypothetical protein
MDGELCYNTKTQARLRLSEIPLRHHRAITPIRIRNKADDALSVQRVRLPVKYLSLYATSEGYLWTEIITLERMKGDDQATLEVGNGVPRDIVGAVLVSPPREESKTNLITRPFSIIAHTFKDA